MKDDGLSTAERLRQLQQITRLLVLAFVAIGLALVYWNVIRANAILIRPDNPRLVEDALRLQRGQIVDRNGRLLAQSVGTGRQTRHYPYATIGPAVGYYSFRHGTAGVEESYDDWLRAAETSPRVELWQQLLNEPRRGHHLQLTLDVEWQLLAGALLPPQPSALLLLELDPEKNLAFIRVMASQPGYDPNELDTQFELLRQDEDGPLLNRVAQGRYQPGRLLLPFVIAGAVEAGWLELNDTAVPATPAILIGDQPLTCLGSLPETPTWADVLRQACPYPVTRLGEQIGPATLASLLADFGFAHPPTIPLATTPTDFQPIVDAALAVIGQEQLTLSPLQIGRAWAALGQDGRLPALQLVTAVRPHEAPDWQPVPPTLNEELLSPVSASTAHQMRQALTQADNRLEYSLLVLSGPDQSNNSWYLGLAPADNPRYALIIVVENTADPQAAAIIGHQLWPSLLP